MATSTDTVKKQLAARRQSSSRIITDREELDNYDLESEHWRKALNRSYRNHYDISSVLDNISDVDDEVYHLFDTKITPYIAQQMDPYDPECPIRLQYIPESDELYQAPHEVGDSLGEDDDTVEGTSVVHRYPNRILFLVFNVCASYCRYCTRKRMVSNQDRTLKKDELRNSLDYIAGNEKIEDVLLSGGDPLLLSDKKLDQILGDIRERAPHVRFLRIGSRLPVQLPTRITPQLCDILDDHKVNMVNIHINHPKEITPLLAKRIRMLRKSGVMIGNQAVMLRGVNDSVEVMRELCMKLVEIGVRPYYVYACDPTRGNSKFLVPLDEMLEIYHGLRGWISGPAVPTFIVDGLGGLGKLPVQPEYVSQEDGGRIVGRNYEGREADLTYLEQ